MTDAPIGVDLGMLLRGPTPIPWGVSAQERWLIRRLDEILAIGNDAILLHLWNQQGVQTVGRFSFQWGVGLALPIDEGVARLSAGPTSPVLAFGSEITELAIGFDMVEPPFRRITERARPRAVLVLAEILSRLGELLRKFGVVRNRHLKPRLDESELLSKRRANRLVRDDRAKRCDGA